MGVEAHGEGVVDPEAFTALVDHEGLDVYSYLARRASAEAHTDQEGDTGAHGPVRSWQRLDRSIRAHRDREPGLPLRPSALRSAPLLA